jgi:hypothetical protein
LESRNLMDLIAGLSSDQQAAVEEFIKYLKQHSRQAAQADFHDLLDRFVQEHSELLQRLARGPATSHSKSW